jgi:predicted dehydrogenase
VVTGLRVRRVMAVKKCIHSQSLEDLMMILVEFENGVVGQVDVSKVSHARSGRFEFVCEDGHLQADQIHGYLEIVRKNKIVLRKEYEQSQTVKFLLEEWAGFLEGKKKNPVSADDGLYAVIVCDACLASAGRRSWVEI